jgi:hypothetical protein
MNDRSTHGQMAEESLRQKTRCPSEEKRNAGFSSFQGSKHRSTDHTKMHNPPAAGSLCGNYKPFKDLLWCTYWEWLVS